MPDHDRANDLSGVSTIGQYHIIRQLGRGGMGTVFLARDAVLGRVVAIKVLDERISEAGQGLERFYQEARATARLSHPNIVTLYSVGSHERLLYFVLEFVRGESLIDRVRRERVPLWEVVRILSGMATGVAAAHAAGVLHLDIKPSNVIISTDGRVRVLDFGVARLLSRRPTGDHDSFDSFPELPPELLVLTGRGGADEVGLPPNAGTGQTARDATITAPNGRVSHPRAPLLGTPAYMAPEQFSGFSSKATDVWALGVIAYELCTGVRPYQAESIDALMLKVTSQDPVPVTPAFRDLPSALSELTLQCLAKDPVERPSAEEVAARLAALDTRAPSSDSDETTPFRALRPFSEQDAAVFFGRDGEIAASLERLRNFSFVPVVGPSGVGKSSLVRAGVIPKLRESANWSIVRLRPGPRPLRALAAQLLAPGSTTRTAISTKDTHREEEATVRDFPRALATMHELSEAKEVSEQIVDTDDPDRLAAALLKSPDILGALLRKRADEDACRVLVFVDQLEEVVTMCESPQERAAFMDALCAASSDVEEPVRVLVTIRDDYPGRIPWGPFAQTVLSGMLMLGPPSDTSLRDTIIRPLRARGYAFDDPDLLDTILDAVHGEEMRLPLLQFCMTQLWQDRDQTHRKLLRSAYVRMGEVGGALAAHAERAVEALSPSELSAARAIFLRLLNPEGMRRMITRSRLTAGLGQEADAAVNILVHARLLAVRKGEPQGEDEPVVELAHESLAKLWRRLAAWFSESKDEIRALSSVVQAAESWERRGRGVDGLWTGDALLEARLAISRSTSPAPPVALEFINACERRQTLQRRLRRLLVGGVIAATATIAVFASLTSWALREKAEAQAEGRKRAERERARSLEESALGALANQDTPTASGQLRTLLESGDSPNARLAWQRVSTTPLLWRKRFGYHTYAVSFRPGSDRFAAASRSGHVYVLDPLTLTTTTLRGHRDQVLGIDYTPNGSLLLSAALDGEVRVWDTATQVSQAFQLGSGPAMSLRVAPKGELAAVGWDHGGITVVSLPDCKKVSAFAHEQRDVRALTWIGGGASLAVGASDGTIRTFNAFTGEQTHEFNVHKTVSSLASNPEGSLLAVGTRDGAVSLCEEAEPGCRELDLGHEAVVRSVAFTSDGMLVASGSQDGHINLWDVKNRGLRTQIDSMLGSVLSIDFDATGTRLAASGQQGVELWKVPERVSTPGWRMHGLFGPVWTTEISPDERWVLAGGEGRFAVLERQTAKLLAVVDTGSAEVRALAPLEDGERLVLVRVDGRVEVRSLPYARLIDEKSSPASSGAISAALVRTADGSRRIVTGLSDGKLTLWSVDPLRPIRVIFGHRDSVRALAASPTGLQFVSGGADGILRLWGTKTWNARILLRRSDSVWGAAFHPTGESVAFVTDSGFVGIVDLRGEARRVWQHSHRLWRVAFHPDGKQLAVASADGNAYLVDIESGASTVIERHGDEVNDVRFGSSGSVLLTASDDGTIRLRDTTTHRPVWYGTGFVGSPPVALTHAGWVGAKAGAVAEAKRPWENTLRYARSVSRNDSAFCILGLEGRLERWSVGASKPTLALDVPDGEKVQVVPDGCVVVGRESATWHARSGPRELPPGTTAVTWSEQRGLLAANATSLYSFHAEGFQLQAHMSGGVAAVLDTGEAVVVGHDDGAVEVRAWSMLDSVASQFDSTPPAAVSLLRPAAAGAVVAGFIDGSVGLWDPKNGRKHLHRYAFGRVIDVLTTEEGVIAITDLGDHMALDLSVLQVPYCTLMRQVWAEAPLFWQDGILQPRLGTPGHPCWNEPALPSAIGASSTSAK